MGSCYCSLEELLAPRIQGWAQVRLKQMTITVWRGQRAELDIEASGYLVTLHRSW